MSYESMMAEFRKQQEDIKQAFEASKNLPEGLQIGKLFSLPVADGAAVYEIVKINQSTVKVKWRKDLTIDEWQDRVLGAGCSVKRATIERIVHGEEALRKLFSRPQK